MSVEIIFGLLISLAMVWLVSFTYSREEVYGNPFLSPLVLFVVFFLAVFLGGGMYGPVGPALWEVHWLPYVLVGGFLALYTFALVMPRRFLRVRDSGSLGGVPSRMMGAYGLFTWLIVIYLLVLTSIRIYTTSR